MASAAAREREAGHGDPSRGGGHVCRSDAGAAGFLLSRIDKQTTLAQIVDRCGLPQLDALRILSELYLQRVMNLED
jgi:hypothetical protein